ncbi:MAG: MgtC/SapB family protein [Gammaproteobacteria bacterium]
MDFGIFEPLAIALGLGLLVGTQRERDEEHRRIAGVRTFALITLVGAVCGVLAESHGGWVIASGLLGVTALFILGNVVRMRQDPEHAGLTTEIAGLLMFGVGAMLTTGIEAPAVALAGVAAVLLQWKTKLHGLISAIGEREFAAMMQFVLVALVILPVVPDQTMGPYDVLNPFTLWLMVTLIVGISLAAYLAYRVLGVRGGSLAGGILGGLISSTATTVSYARQCAGNPAAAPAAALVILIASTIVYARVGIELGAVAPDLLRLGALPLAAMTAFMAVLCSILFMKIDTRSMAPPDLENPAQLRTALVFGVLYAVILLLVTAVREEVGNDAAIYGVAVISGLTDVDALTLSTAELFSQERLSGDAAWRAILIATLSNLAFKIGATAVLGGRRLATYAGVTLGLSILFGLGIVMFWPAGSA